MTWQRERERKRTSQNREREIDTRLRSTHTQGLIHLQANKSINVSVIANSRKPGDVVMSDQQNQAAT